MPKTTEEAVVKAFGKRFKKLMDEYPKPPPNQKVWGKELGVTQQSVSDYRNGKQIPSVTQGIAIAEFFDVSFEWLMTGRGAQSIKETVRQLTKEEISLLKYWKYIDKQRRARLLDHAYDLVTASELQDKTPLIEVDDPVKRYKIPRKTKTKAT